ncbi:unnamed protein product [Blepharisma stoltei]|uniref:Protein kinase domain-containing protein n=1 Tax=Blepharisma stoltei TaxID=1481888 RepID=A0AAU9J578_9CILI|nr:unnamed protein product [Blepharisma stoltei]
MNSKKNSEHLNKGRNRGFKILNKEDIIFEKDLYLNLTSNSRIYKGWLESENKKVIFKECIIEKSKNDAIKLVCNELANAIFLSKKDEIFMEFYGLYIDFDPQNKEFTFGFAMEQCDIDLETAIKEKLLRSDKNIEYCIDTLLKGFKLMHDYGIVHRDIKPQNIFVKKYTDGWKFKIADYNASSVVSKGTAIFSDLALTNKFGQPTYLPPEVYSQMDGEELPQRIIMNKQKSDVYALALVFLELNIQDIPFHTPIEREQWMKDYGWNYINNEIKANWLKELLTLMQAKNPMERKRLSELVKIRKSYQISV